LLGARVLRLVDEHVVDAAVELVVHPGGALVLEQVERLVDQIVVIEQPAPVLLGAEAGDDRIGDGEQRAAAVAGLDGALALDQPPDAVALLVQPLAQVWVGLLDGAGGDAILGLGARLGAEDIEIGLDALRRR